MNDRSDKPGFWSRLGRGITWFRIILSNVFFFLFLFIVLMLLFSGAPVPEVPEQGALVLNPRGAVVEQRSPVDPIQQWLAPQAVLAETELTEILDALDHAREDDRIPLVVLDLDDLQFLSATHANRIGQALAAVRDAGKQVVAYGSYYDQQPYLMASFADAIYMHPFGQVMLPGYNMRQLYFQKLLEDLKVNVHVFRAGKYKEFVEPYTRTNMSEEAREANRALVNDLWSRYGETITGNRRLEAQRFQRYTQSYHEAAAETGGDLARLAVEYHMVDELLTPDQARARIADVVGYDDNGSFNGIAFQDYLQAVNGQVEENPAAPQVAVITAQGPIVMGDQVTGVIAAERVISLIRRARDDSSISALVFRINTPGGSSFASELIRQELELLQLTGKPVVISMGPTAASGGYWVSSTADAILAEPTTLTGSIGVFGIVPTFEDSLEAIGISTDGVETTPLSNMNLLTEMSEPTERVMQLSTENIYQRFVNLVARGRDMPPERVNDIAQGRVWTGAKALELGLVDALGGKEEAIARAAELAELEVYGVRRLRPPLTPRELLMRQLFSNFSVETVTEWLDTSTVLSPLVREAKEAVTLVGNLNDPKGSYAVCLSCMAL